LLGVAGGDGIDSEQDGDMGDRVEGGVRGDSHISMFLNTGLEPADDAGDSKPQVAAHDEYSSHRP
jgi:hypothetical protein